MSGQLSTCNLRSSAGNKGSSIQIWYSNQLCLTYVVASVVLCVSLGQGGADAIHERPPALPKGDQPPSPLLLAVQTAAAAEEPGPAAAMLDAFLSAPLVLCNCCQMEIMPRSCKLELTRVCEIHAAKVAFMCATWAASRQCGIMCTKVRPVLHEDVGKPTAWAIGLLQQGRSGGSATCAPHCGVTCCSTISA